MLSLDPRDKQEALQISKTVENWGIGINDDLVIDPGSHYFLDMAGVIPMMRDHSIKLRSSLPKAFSTLLPRSRSL